MSKPGVQIREANSADVAKIVELSSALFREDAGERDPFMNLAWPRQEGREYFATLLARSDSLCLLAIYAGQVVGYLVGRTNEESNLRPVKIAELESMYVCRSYRDRGVGARLIKKFLEWGEAWGAQRASVTAYATNERAIRFYERSGFKPKSLSMEKGLG